MKLTDREKVIVLLLPAAVVLGAYAWYFAYSLRPKVNEARAAYKSAVAGQVHPGQLQQERAALDEARKELARMTAAHAQLKREAATLAGQLNNPGVRLEAVAQLTTLLQRHRLRLIDDSAEAQGANKLPQALRDSVARLGSDGNAFNAQIRCLQLAGSYRDLLGAVAELASQADSPAVPVALNMADVDPDVEERVWTLWVWM